MQLLISFSIVGLAALIHASFQLSISTFTLMSGHALGHKKSQEHLTHLTTGFVLGAGAMTLLLLVAFCYGVDYMSRGGQVPPLFWAAGCGLLVGIGVAVWMFYYRPTKGTVLWLPRRTANYLADRCKKTSNPGEAFGLGLASVFGELLFIMAPLLVSAFVITTLAGNMQIVAIILYTVVSLSSLLVVAALVGSGHKLSAIQKWRESNKHFLQFAAGSGLLILGFYLYVNEVLALPLAMGAGS